MHLKYQTEQNDTLTHQVRFTTTKNKIFISCNCRKTVGDHEKAGKPIYKPMAVSTGTLADDAKIYNDPANHWAPFTKEDEAKWG